MIIFTNLNCFQWLQTAYSNGEGHPENGGQENWQENAETGLFTGSFW